MIIRKCSFACVILQGSIVEWSFTWVTCSSTLRCAFRHVQSTKGNWRTKALSVFCHLLHCFSSVPQSCLMLCIPMQCSSPAFPVLHHLTEHLAHAHWVGDAIQPSYYSVYSPSFSHFVLSFFANGFLKNLAFMWNDFSLLHLYLTEYWNWAINPYISSCVPEYFLSPWLVCRTLAIWVLFLGVEGNICKTFYVFLVVYNIENPILRVEKIMKY